MKTGFKNRIEVSNGKKTKSPWDFTCPSYDQRSSCFVSAGQDYGVGKNVPVGKTKSSNEGHVPMGRVDTLQVEYINEKEPKLIDIQE